MQTQVRLPFLLGLTLLSTCAACSTASPGSSATTSVAADGCTVSLARHGPLPSKYNEFGDADPPPWVAGAGGVAVLFYAAARDGDTTIGTHGSMGPGKNSKILWLTDREISGGLTLTATNPATGETVTESLDGSTNFPSTPSIPSPGCWTIRAVSGEHEIATLQLRAVDFE